MNKPTNIAKRPKKPPLRTELIMLRVTAAQYRNVARAAKRSGLEVAVLCRTLVLDAIEQGRESRIRGNVLSAHPGALGQESDGSPLPETGS